MNLLYTQFQFIVFTQFLNHLQIILTKQLLSLHSASNSIQFAITRQGLHITRIKENLCSLARFKFHFTLNTVFTQFLTRCVVSTQ